MAKHLHSVSFFFLLTVTCTQPERTAASGTAATGFQIAYGGTNNEWDCRGIQAADGGYVMAGNSNTAIFITGGFDHYLVKTDNEGNETWSGSYGGTGTDRCYGMAQASDNGFILTGETLGFGVGSNDVYLVKTSSTGTLQWSKTFGTSSVEETSYAVIQTSDGGYALTGRTGTTPTEYQMYLVKTNASGNIGGAGTFSKSFDGGAGNFHDQGYDLAQLSDGSFIVAGQTAEFGPGGSNILLTKITSSGTLGWAKAYGGTGSEDGRSVIVTSDGGFLTVGFTGSAGAGSTDISVVKYSSAGSVQWAKAIGSTGSDEGKDAVQAADGSYYVTGRSLSNTLTMGGGDIYLMRLNSSGALQWYKAYGGTGAEIGYSMSASAGGGFTLGGTTASFGNGLTDGFLVRTDADGECGCNTLPAVPAVFDWGPTIATTAGNFTITNIGVSTSPASATIVPATLTDIECVTYPPLPVELLYFTGKQAGHAIELSWESAMPVQGEFIVERKQEEEGFPAIGAGRLDEGSAPPAQYHFTDAQPVPGINYYRLRSVDHDGRTDHSGEIAVEFEPKSNKAQMYTDARGSLLTIEYEDARQAERFIYLRVFSLTGKKVYDRQIYPEGNRFTADLSSLPPGTWCAVTHEGNVLVFITR